jgi:hypothetical protein
LVAALLPKHKQLILITNQAGCKRSISFLDQISNAGRFLSHPAFPDRNQANSGAIATVLS